ncbi:hypothetical protein ACCO45_013964 [Purpureocillium lilacinum]|uniref:Uncharacterized protein n=1 Tax=Purpureocillium lilacinum TaxID=33203 RepID=A0ACC4D8U4_PURLI
MVLASLLLLAPAAWAASLPLGILQGPKLENLVTFGDSYTDEGRYTYMVQNKRLPPVDSMLPASNTTWSGGYAWGRYVANRTGATYYDYAAPFPSVLNYEMTAFEEGLKYTSLYPNRRDDNTVYALWIGTNDLGIDGFLGDRENGDQTLDSFVDCIWSVFDRIYQTGGRRFVLLTELPLETAPMYAQPSVYGRGNDRYWADPSHYDVTAYLDKLKDSIAYVNSAFKSGAATHFTRAQKRWKGATLAIFDTHQLWLDVRADPGQYLSAPANTDGAYRNCLNGCVFSPNPLSSFMWYDELHPSQRMEEIIASNFIDVVGGQSNNEYIVG